MNWEGNIWEVEGKETAEEGKGKLESACKINERIN